MDFHFEAKDGDTSTSSFTLRYELDKTTVTVKLEDVKESPGYELISVNLPRLVTAREEDTGPWLAHGDSGDKRSPAAFRVDGNQIGVSAQVQQPIMVYRNKAAARLA